MVFQKETCGPNETIIDSGMCTASLMSGDEINTMEVDQGQVNCSFFQRITNSQIWETLMKLKDRITNSQKWKTSMKLLDFFLAGWMLADIVLDILSCIKFYRKAQANQISHGYFLCGLTFLCLPMGLSMMYMMCFGLCLGESCLDIMKGMVIFTVYVICLPITAILLTGANLILGDDNVVAKKLKGLKYPILVDVVTLLKLFEILGESLPQLILGITFIVNNGGAVTHPLNTCSAVLSGGSVLIGLITSGIMWKKKFC